MHFVKAIVLCSISIAVASSADAWTFSPPEGSEGQAVLDTGNARTGFSCIQKGSEGHDPTSLTWFIGGADIMQTITVKDGEIARVGLALDSSSVGEGPFLKVDATQIATSLPQALPLVERMRVAKEITFSIGDTSVALPLTGLDPALDALIQWCNTEPTAPVKNLTQAQCAAPANVTDRLICDTPALTALETEMLAAFAVKSEGLAERELTKLRSDQSNWTTFRQNCADSVGCIEAATKARIATFAKPATSAPVSPAATALQTQPVQAKTLGVPIVPMQPAELGGVIWDQKQIQIKSIIEAVRAQPDLVDRPQVLQTWAQVALQQPRNQAGGDLIAREHLLRSIAANPPGPFLIGRFLGQRIRTDVYANGAIETGLTDNLLSNWRMSVQGVGAIDIRARTQIDMERLPASPAQLEYIKGKVRQMRLGVVYQVDAITALGAAQSNAQLVARGQVRFAGLFEAPQQRNQVFDPQTLLAVFQMKTGPGPAAGLAGAAQILKLPLIGGRVFDNGLQTTNNRGTSGLQQLVSWAALRKNAPQSLTDNLRQLAFFTLATQRERDAVIDPFYFANGTQGTFYFDQFVDEFERGELLDGVDQTLWPVVRTRLPDTPIEVIASRTVILGEYDRGLGAFPLNIAGDPFSMARQGQFPAFRAMPDMLVLPVAQARELVAYLESVGGAGFRRLTMVAQYRIEDVGQIDPATFRNRSELPAVTVVPLGLSLHGYQTLAAGQSPLDQKIMDFDLASFRGPERPVADPGRVAFWQEINKAQINTQDDLALAAVRLADGEGVVARIAERSNAVRQAGEFSKAQVLQDTIQRLQAGAKAGPLTLSGAVQLGQYNPQAGAFGIEGLNYTIAAGPQGLSSPRIALSDPGLLTRLVTDQQTAALMVASQQRRNLSFEFTMWVTPELASDDGRQSTLFVTPTRFVVRAQGDDGTGYPPAFIELVPEPVVQAKPEQDAAQVAVDAPSVVPLDSDYLDLAMIRDRPDSINDTTYKRMMYDRRLRESKARETGLTPEWGWFFGAQWAVWTPVQERDMVERFKQWTLARAKVLPDTVYVQSQGIGFSGVNLACWAASRLNPGDIERVFPNGLPGDLTVAQLNRHSILMSAFVRTSGQGIHVLPSDYRTIAGSPALSVSRSAVVDSAQSACVGQQGRQMRNFSLDGSAHTDAMIELRGAIRKPLPREQVLVYRDYGKVRVENQDDAAAHIVVEVDRTALLEVVTTGNKVQLVAREDLTLDSLPEAPQTVDIFDVRPGDPWETARAAAATRLPEAVVFEEDGPPRNLRIVTQNTAFGDEQQFQALQNGHIFVDPAKGEALALLREAERDPDRVIGIGSYRTFSSSAASQDALIGALLRKYGDSPEASDFNRFGGPRPGQTLIWGGRSGCVPRMDNEVRPTLNAYQGDPRYQVLANTARMFRAPQLMYSEQNKYSFENCGPFVWAAVGEDREKRVHLIVWSIDLSVMQEVAEMPDLVAKPDGKSGSETLIENAADIEL